MTNLWLQKGKPLFIRIETSRLQRVRLTNTVICDIHIIYTYAYNMIIDNNIMNSIIYVCLYIYTYIDNIRDYLKYSHFLDILAII